MDNIYQTEELELLRDQVRRFVQEEIEPNGDAWEEARSIPKEAFKKLGALGVFGIRYDEEYGGSGMNAIASVVAGEELGRTTYNGFAVAALVNSEMSTPHLARQGSAEQKARYLPGIVAGDIVTAIAVTEPGAGSDVSNIRTTAKRKGNNAWVLNGTKMFITNGVQSDILFVAARTDPSVKNSRGISMFIVERDTPGFKVGRKLEKMGWHCSDTAELVFEDAEIPAENLMGEENRGFYAIMENFQNERLVIGAIMAGMCLTAIDLTLDYVRTREAFGRTLWDNSSIRQRLAALAGRVEAFRQLLYHAAWLDAQGRDCVKEVSMIKALGGDLVNDVTYDCLQFHGGTGYMHGTAIERLYRDARVHAIGGGATEVMWEEVAKRL